MGLLTGITNGINEIFDSTINKLGTWGAPGPNFSPIGSPPPHEIGDKNPALNLSYGSPVGDPLAPLHEPTEATLAANPTGRNLGSPVCAVQMKL